MPLTDSFGRTWAHRHTVKVGDVLVCDGGFSCMRAGERKIVKTKAISNKEDIFDYLYVECDHGSHMLDGQLGDDGELIGLYPATQR